MIVAKRKPFDEIKAMIKPYKKVLNVGCGTCVSVCPFGAMSYNILDRKVIKCDLCGGDPACARACPTDAITYIDADWTGYGRMQASAAKSLPSAEANA